MRSRTVMTIRSGQDLLTCADCTCVMASTRLAAAPVSTRIIGTPTGIAATARTWLTGTTSVPLTTTDRTTSSFDPSSAQAMPATRAAATTPKNAVRHGLRPRRWGGRPGGGAPGRGLVRTVAAGRAR